MVLVVGGFTCRAVTAAEVSSSKKETESLSAARLLRCGLTSEFTVKGNKRVEEMKMSPSGDQWG